MWRGKIPSVCLFFKAKPKKNGGLETNNETAILIGRIKYYVKYYPI